MFSKLLNCGRLGRRAADHPWSALRVVKSCRKDCPTASVLPKPKQRLCIQNGTRAHYLNYLPNQGGCGGEKKRRQSDRLSGDRWTLEVGRLVGGLLLVDDDAGVIHRLDGYAGPLPGDLFEAIVGPETCANVYGERLQQGAPILYNAELASDPQSSPERNRLPSIST